MSAITNVCISPYERKNKNSNLFKLLFFSSLLKSLLLLLLSHFSRVWLCATPQMAAHQAPPSLGSSRQEYWSELLFPSSMHESEVAQSSPTPSDPMDCSLPGSSVHGICQARVLEWGAITFSIYTSYVNDNQELRKGRDFCFHQCWF